MITSLQNETVKEILCLKRDKKYIFLDNPKLLSEAVNFGYLFEYLLKVDVNTYKEFDMYAEKLLVVSEHIYKKISNTVTSQGVIAVIKFEPKNLKPPDGLFLVLDGLQDPGNVGTLIRTALGTGFKDVYLLNSININNDKLIRSSSGAIFKVNIYTLDRREFIDLYKNVEIPLYSADMNGVNIFEENINLICGVAIGNEGNGVSEEIKGISTAIISLPMSKELESLNAAVSGSVIMYEITFGKDFKR